MTQVILKEADRKAMLLSAQQKAWDLLALVEENKLVKIGSSEQEITDQIFELAKSEFGITKHWHKRIVRAGINSILNSKANPENRVIEFNDLVYVDLGPVFEEFEGDVGKTYLLGDDARKNQLISDLTRIFEEGKAHYLGQPEQTGQELFYFVAGRCRDAGWTFGNDAAGHIVSEFAHVQMYGQNPQNRISRENVTPMNAPGIDGHARYWILEVHLVDPAGQFGGFFEDILLN